MTVLPSDLDPQSHPGAGRRSRLTRETADKIIEAVEQGSYLKVAAQAAGIGQSTLAAWLARGRQAASVREAHDPDRRYCPDCDLDREDAAAAVARANDREDQRRADDPAAEPRGYAVLDRCPRCGSDAYPASWRLPDTEAPYVEFLESVTRAQAVAETDAVAAWRRAFTGHEPDWRAARDYLARTAPERWAGVTRVQMTTEEADRRVDDAVNETLLAMGINAAGDPVDDALDEGIDA